LGYEPTSLLESRHPTLEELDAIAPNNPIHCNSAYASYEEDIKESIEVGKLADIIVLDRDILSCSKERFNEVKVEMTMIDGDFEYIR
jgi:Amidohydrolase family